MNEAKFILNGYMLELAPPETEATIVNCWIKSGSCNVSEDSISGFIEYYLPFPRFGEYREGIPDIGRESIMFNCSLNDKMYNELVALVLTGELFGLKLEI